jgi:cellulose synthase/poly-beta-1,6-N-acetylglucosamine synthase-like glycosyltransferase
MQEIIGTVVSIIFLVLIVLHLSWIAIFLIPQKKHETEEKPELSIIIPAHNEGKNIKETIESVIKADYGGKKEVIVVDDGSTDDTSHQVEMIKKQEKTVKLMHTDHVGKACAINEGVKKSSGNLIVVLDGDSKIKEDALHELTKNFTNPNVGAVSGIVRGKTTGNPLTWFQDFEYIQSSAWRHICAKVGGTYIFPGFAAFNKKAYVKVGGFSKDTYSEDLDIGLRLKKAGYELRMCKAIIYTALPDTLPKLIRQRFRWGKGTFQAIKKHKDMIFNKKYGGVGLYGLPTQIYWFFHFFVYVPAMFYQVVEGYGRSFLENNIIISKDVFMYFFSWFTAYGVFEYSYKTYVGQYDPTSGFYLLTIMFSLYIAYNIILLFKFEKPTPRYLLVLFLFFPYAIFALTLHTLPAIREALKPTEGNVWEKRD